MTCTNYARGIYLSNDDVEDVVLELKKTNQSSYTKELDGYAREAIVLHNRAMNMQIKLNAGVITYYESGSSDLNSDIVTDIDISEDGTITIELLNGLPIRYKETTEGLQSYGRTSSDLERAIINTPRYEEDIESLFNVDSNGETVDEAIGSSDILNERIDLVQNKLAEIDRNSANGHWDAEHSAHLQNLSRKMQKLVKELSVMKITVTKDIAKNILEPVGEFNPVTGQIRVATADISEIARNRFIMSNEEALVHETVHAYIRTLFNKQLGVLGQDVKDDLYTLYRTAKKQLTYKDFLPEDEGPYNEAEIQKAKDMYKYIFEGKIDDSTVIDANRRIQEFFAYGLTNKYVKNALANVDTKYDNSSEQGDSVISRLFYKAMKALQDFLHNINVKRGRGKNIDAELTRLAVKLGEINYTKANLVKENAGVRVDKKFSEWMNNTADKADDLIHGVVNNSLEKLNLKAKDVKESGKLTKDQEIENQKTLHKLFEYAQGEMKKATDKTKGRMYRTWHFTKALPALTKIYSTISDKDTDEYIKYRINLDTAMREAGGKYYKLLQDLIADFSSGRKTLIEITDRTMMFKSHLDRMRDMYVKGTMADIAVGFTKIDIFSNKNLKYNKALNKVVLRSDFQAVSTDAEVLKYYIDEPSKLDKDIKDLENDIMNINYNEKLIGSTMIKDAKSVAKYMRTKKGLRSNAENIARHFGTRYSIPYGENSYDKSYSIEDTSMLIDKLISLYALKDTSPEYKNNIKELIDIDANGVSSFLLLAKGMNKTSKYDWGLHGVVQEMVKGELHERNDANKDLVYAPLDAYTLKKMKDLGYKLDGPMHKDDADISEIKYGVYYNDNAGITSRVDGAFGLQRLQVKGLLLSQKIKQDNPALSENSLRKKISDAIKYAARNGKNEQMYPVYNLDGNIIDFRYENTLEDKEKYIDLEQRGTDLLSRTFGRKNTQVETDTNNEELIDLIYKDKYETLKKMNKDGSTKDMLDKEFVRVYASETMKTKAELKQLGADESGRYSVQSEGEELWGLLPPATRKYIIRKNRLEDIKRNPGNQDPEPRKEIYIRKDLMKQLFGYNEASISNIKFIKNLPVKQQRYVRLAEQYAMALMAITKSMVVIKLPKTIIGNILSNAKFLFFSGMPISDALKYLILSKKSLDKWKKDEKRRRDLERKIEMHEGIKKAKLEKELADLTVELKSNPLVPLIEAGLYQTIVEDVNLEEDNNIIVNKIEREFYDSAIGENKVIKDIVNNMFLTRNSALGKALLNITQESDLHFRAATYWYAIENGTDKKQALRDVTDNFINYSKIINSKYVKWLDKLGPQAFYKYFANIQRVNLKLIKNNTAKVIADSAGKTFFDLPNDTLESSMFSSWSRRLNPFNWINNTVGLIENSVDVPITQLVDGY